MSTTRELIDRLNRGWLVCNRETAPVRRARLEAHWIRLLHAYETASKPPANHQQGEAA